MDKSSTTTSSPTIQSMPVPPAPVFELLGLQFIQWPGGTALREHAVAVSRGRVHGRGRYDALIADPADYFRRTLLPRIGTAFAPLAGLDSFINIMEASMMSVNMLPFANPAVLEGVQRLAQAAQECLRG